MLNSASRARQLSSSHFAAAFSDPHVNVAGAVDDIFNIMDELLMIAELKGLSRDSKLQLLFQTWGEVEDTGFRIFRASVSASNTDNHKLHSTEPFYIISKPHTES